VLTTPPVRPERTSSPTVAANPTIVWFDPKGNKATSCHAYPGHWAITGQPHNSIKSQS